MNYAKLVGKFKGKMRMFSMGKGLFVLVMLLFMASATYAGSIVLEGTYQGKNLYVRNPYAGSGVGFCTYEVTVNGNVTTDEINSSAFEVDFANFELSIGDKVVIIIKHKDDCTPKVLNPEVITPKSTFKTESIEVSDDGLLQWKTSGETGVLTYIVEQYRWNKWVYVGEVEGKGISGKINSYQFQVTPHSGLNKVRVKQVDYTRSANVSPVATFNASTSPIAFNPKRVQNEVVFTGETMYEVYDIHGNIVKKGFAGRFDASNLKKGLYYLSYDNTTETFQKK